MIVFLIKKVSKIYIILLLSLTFVLFINKSNLLRNFTQMAIKHMNFLKASLPSNKFIYRFIFISFMDLCVSHICEDACRSQISRS